VAVLVAILGTGQARGLAHLTTFRHAWWVAAAVALVGAVPALVLIRRRVAAAPAD
jgi:hypothetical protein